MRVKSEKSEQNHFPAPILVQFLVEMGYFRIFAKKSETVILRLQRLDLKQQALSRGHSTSDRFSRK